MLILTSLAGFGGSIAAQTPPFDVQYHTITSSGSSLTSYTFSSMPIGDAASDRLVVVGVQARVSSGQSNVTSVTIGGVAATEIATIDPDPGTTTIGLWQAAVPTGTTASVVVSFGGQTQTECGLAVFSIRNMGSTTPSDTVATSGSTRNTHSTTGLTVPDGGGAVLFALDTDANSTAFSWSGATGQGTTRVATTDRYISAAMIPEGDGSAPTISVTGTGVAGVIGLLGAAWAPL